MRINKMVDYPSEEHDTIYGCLWITKEMESKQEHKRK